MDEQTNVKKPLWKRWWFWAIVIVIIIALGSSGDESTTPTSKTGDSSPAATTPAELEPDNAIKSGMYKVGSDIAAGEYVLITNRGAYFAITSDSSGSLESILANDNFDSRSIVSVNDGEYLELKGCEAYPFAEAPAVDKSSEILESGMYKVGVDIPAGEYKVESISSMGYIEVSSNSSHSLNAIVANDNFEGSKYISVTDGQYLKLSNVKVYLNN
jgi:hypothetical protein